MGFQFWLKRREWRQIPDCSDRERKSSIITVSHCLKCSLPGFDPGFEPSPGSILCNRSTDNEKLCTSSNYRPADFCHDWLHWGQSGFPLLALMGNQLFNNSYSSYLLFFILSLTCLVCTARATLRASLSGTFLQTLPDLVTPLKGHSLSPHSCPLTWSVPSARFGYWYDCRSTLAPKHSHKHETHPPQV